jgi:hypothetical protein
MRLAVHEEDNCPDRAVMAPVNAESFFTYSHNGDDYQEEEQSSSGIFDEPNPKEDWNQNKAEYREDDSDPPLSLLNDTTTEVPSAQDQALNDPDDSEEDLTYLEDNQDYDKQYFDDPQDDHNTNYFTVGIVSEENPTALLMDSMMGLEIFSKVYSLLNDNSSEQTVRRSNITECISKIDMPDNTTVTHSIKVDSCNSRMLAGERFLQEIKSCYEYGLPPIRMKTTSKQPTTWKRDVGQLNYYDNNDIKCVSLVYVDYDNPELILMDLNTILDAEVDLQYHAKTSRDSGVVSLKRCNEEPYHYGNFSKQSEPLQSLKPPSTEDSSKTTNPLASSVRTLRRSSRKSTKKAFLNRSVSPEQSGIKPRSDPDDDCTCDIRRVESFLTEDYNRLVDGLSELNLRRFNETLISPNANGI